MSRSRRFTWTLNNPTEQQKEALLTLYNDGLITYFVWGEEIAPTTNTPHLQGYLEVAQKTTLKALQKKLQNAQIHLALMVSKGTAMENKTYCLKSGGASLEIGTPLQQGKRNDLDLIVTMIREGKTLKEIWEAHPKTMIIHRKGVMEALAALQTGSYEKPSHSLINFSDDLNLTLSHLQWRTLILWGESGCGKTTIALNLLPRALFVSHLDSLRLYNTTDYDGIIFDDMNFTHLPRESQIHITDWDYDRWIHLRYNNALIPKHTKKIFTTNNIEGSIFLNDSAINRRITIQYISKEFI